MPEPTDPTRAVEAVRANWSSAWRELTGYVAQAHSDGTQIDPHRLLIYMAELKRRALMPVADWMDTLRSGGDPS